MSGFVIHSRRRSYGRLMGLVAGAVIMAGLWFMGHGGGGATTSTAPAYCPGQATFTILTSVGKTGTPGDADRLAHIQVHLEALTAQATAAGRPLATAALTSLAADVRDWRMGILTHDAVEQDIALNRTLSEMTTIPGC